MVSSQLDDQEYAQMSAAAAQNPDAEYTVGGTTLTVKGSEIAGLPKDQAVALVVGRIAVVNYEQGPDAAEALITASGEDGEDFSLGPVGVLTQSTHDAVRPYRRHRLAVGPARIQTLDRPAVGSPHPFGPGVGAQHPGPDPSNP